jgi:hypothetical protein
MPGGMPSWRAISLLATPSATRRNTSALCRRAVGAGLWDGVLPLDPKPALGRVNTCGKGTVFPGRPAVLNHSLRHHQLGSLASWQSLPILKVTVCATAPTHHTIPALARILEIAWVCIEPVYWQLTAQ